MFVLSGTTFMNPQINKFSKLNQRSLAYLVLSTTALFATTTQAANIDYERAVQANSESAWDYAPAQEPTEYADEVAEVARAPAAPAVVRINPAYNQRLMETIRRGDLAQVKWLLANGADPEYRNDPSGMTPMHLAAKSGWVQLAQLLHDAGGDFMQASPNGTTYLHIAAASNRLPMVKYLLSIGLDANARTHKGWTPLHHAARFGSYEVAEYLLNQGANPNVYNSDGFTAVGLAENLNHYEAANLLQSVTQVAARTQPRAVQTRVARNSNKGRRTLLSRLGF